MSDTTVNELLPVKPARTTKVEKVVVQRRTITVQTRAVGWAALGLFVLGFAIGNQEIESKANAATTEAPAVTTTVVTQPGK